MKKLLFIGFLFLLCLPFASCNNSGGDCFVHADSDCSGNTWKDENCDGRCDFCNGYRTCYTEFTELIAYASCHGKVGESVTDARVEVKTGRQ